jgi:carbonic anhydrase
METVMKRNFFLQIAVAAVFLLRLGAAAGAQEDHHWSYSGAAGPEHWSEFGASCGLGKAQSPIDIQHAEQKDLPAIHFAYHPSALKVINNGHTIQANYAPGSTITVGGKSYQLVQFHFHHLSETTIEGKHSPMELHLVHKSKDGNLAVVAVFLQEGHGNSTVGTVWANLPHEVEKEFTPEHVEIEAVNLLPADHKYFTFAGSLTTPPCSEGVTWLVLEKPMTLSKEQIAKFAALYPDNARPVQPLNGRVVLESK